MEIFRRWELYIIIFFFIIRFIGIQFSIEFIAAYQVLVLIFLFVSAYLLLVNQNPYSLKKESEFLLSKEGGWRRISILAWLYFLDLHMVHEYLTFMQVGIYLIGLYYSLRYIVAKWNQSDDSNYGIIFGVLFLVGISKAIIYNYGKEEIGSFLSKNEYQAMYYADVEGPNYRAKSKVLLHVNGSKNIEDDYPSEDYGGEYFELRSYDKIQILSIYDEDEEIITFQNCMTLEGQEAWCYDEDDGEWRIDISNKKVK